MCSRTRTSTCSSQVLIPVLFVQRRDAKQLKNALEAASLIDEDRRMGSADPVAYSQSSCTCSSIDEPSSDECICIPVLEECINEYEECHARVDASKVYDTNVSEWMNLVVKSGRQYCTPSASAMAKSSQGGSRRRRRQYNSTSEKKDGSNSNQKAGKELTMLQEALVEMMLQHVSSFSRDGIVQAVTSLSVVACPRKLERFGDDHCLVIPRTALRLDDDEFRSFVERFLPEEASIEECLKSLWSILAGLYSSPRVARRGDIDPESKIRQSGHRLLYPDTFEPIEPGIPSNTGPNAAGWITVTEHGIRQSFDFTRVMFSRGNVTEKERFGKHLVKEGEVVLDMYTGIGYYTLPALVHGKAAHVYCCEWNPDAVAALRYNLENNDVEDRATVLEGDSRITAPQAGIIGIVDRVSLGLLPSSEGGWKVAVQALREKGGWLHVHGNVPTVEKEIWSFWICHRLERIADELGRDGWIAFCSNVQKVKSFAPKVDHYVADVFVGPKGSPACGSICDAVADITTGVLSKEEGTHVMKACPANIKAPSCALSRGGVLSQEWMM